MKHKLVVAMSLLGLISTPAFADSTMNKHKHHKKHHHHHVAHHDYKAMGGMPVQQAPVAETQAPVVTSSLTSSILDEMTQNVNTPRPMPEWFNRIGIAGGVNFDTGKWGSHTVANPNYTAAHSNTGFNGYAGENTRIFSLNNVYLNMSADVYDWAKAFMSLTYTDTSLNYSQSYGTLQNTSVLGNNNANLNIEQAFVRLGNFDCSPVFLEVGKEFQDFGRYTIHPITESMTQVLSETLNTSIKLGFVTDMGFNGSVYTFQNAINKVGSSQNSLNYGAALGYAQPNDTLGYDLGAGYMYNMFGVNDIGTTFAASSYNVSGYRDRVGALAAYADVNFEAFSLGLRYTTALQSFSALNIPQDSVHSTSGARPWAAGVQGGYDFNYWSRNQNIYLGYQTSNQTVALNLPRQRWLVGYGVDIIKNTNLSAEWDHDVSYSIAKGGPGGGNSNLLSVRAAVKFG